jgi:hypothetical protein
MVYFLDDYGYIIAAMSPADAPAPAPSTIDGYVLVLGFRSAVQQGQTTASASNLFNTTTSADRVVAQAQIMNVYTGDVTVVSRSIVNSKDHFVYTDINGVATTDQVVDLVTDDPVDHPKTYQKPELYGYKVMSDGTYYFEPATYQSVKTDKNNANVTGSDGAVYYATNDTIFYTLRVNVKDGEYSYNKTDKQNVYSNKITDRGVIVADGKNVVSEIITYSDKVVEEKDDIKTFVAQFVEMGETNANGTYVNFVVDGKTTSYLIVPESVNTFKAFADKFNGDEAPSRIVKLTTKNGNAQSYTEATPAGTGKVAQVVTGSWVVLEGQTEAINLGNYKVFNQNGVYMNSYKVGDTITYYAAK